MCEEFFVKTKYLPLLAIALVAVILIFPNLASQVLWQDEAETASIARTIFQYGIPKAYDGKNFFSQNAGADYTDDYVWKWHPWLPFYILAASFKVAGETTFAARFPFALFGVGTVLLTYVVGRTIFLNKRLALVASLLLLLSVPFLLLSRQCRWYTLAMFFSMLSLLAYNRMTQGKKFSAPLFIFASTLLFHSNFIYFITLQASVWSHALIFYPRQRRTFVLPLLTSIALNLPWLLLFSDVRYSEHLTGSSLNADLVLSQVLKASRQYALDIEEFLFSPILLILSMLFCGISWWKLKCIAPPNVNRLMAMVFLLLAGVLCLGWFWRWPFARLLIGSSMVLSAFVISLTEHNSYRKEVLLFLFFTVSTIAALVVTVPYPFFRYLAPLIPVLTIVIAAMFERGMELHPVLGVAVIVVFLSQGKLLGEYFYELTHRYKGPMDGIVQYFQQHGSANDTVLITYGDITLAFYTKMKVVGGLTGEKLSPYTNPQWIIVRKYTMGFADSTIRDHIWTRTPWKEYDVITLPFPDPRFQNREDPRHHLFRTAQREDNVRIFKRVKR